MESSRIDQTFHGPSSLSVPRPFRQNRLPQFYRLGGIALFFGQDGQISPGEVTEDPIINTGEVFRTSQVEDSPPAFAGLKRLALEAVKDAFAKE
jgi:hypothetical protein